MQTATPNGLQPFSLHRRQQEGLADRLRALGGVAPQGFEALDAEAAARRYLARAFEAPELPALQAPRADGAPSEFVTLGTEAVALTGTTTVKFRQVFHHIPVYGSLVTVELGEGNALLALHSALGEPEGVDPVARLSPAEAWDVLQRRAGKVARAVVPRLHYYFHGPGRAWHLAWIAENVRSVREDVRGPALFDYVVDAHTGELLAELPRVQSTQLVPGGPPPRTAPPLPPSAPAQPQRAEAGTPRPAVSELLEEGLDDEGRSRRFGCSTQGEVKQLVDAAYNLHTYDFAFKDIAEQERELPGAYVTFPPRPWSPAGVSAHANAREVARFLRDVLERDGLDNRGGPIVSSVNCTYGTEEGTSRTWDNAAWIGTQMVYGQHEVDGVLRTYAVALDVVAHEVLHGLTDHTARLEYAGETGALNESYSDIFGILVSNLAEPDVERWSWEMGEQLDETGVPIRDLRTPSKYGQPEHMRDFRHLGPWEDSGGVHINSGIHNKACYHLLTAKAVDGEPALAPREVAALFYLALTQYLSRTSLFADSRRGVELAAATLFRNDPKADEKLECIAAAFDAVGIGAPGVATDVYAPLHAWQAPLLPEAAAAAVPQLLVPYDADFLGDGFQVPTPRLGARVLADAFAGGRPLDYVHYSLVLSERRRVALYTAVNIDGAHVVRLGREGLPWMLDKRVPADKQLGPRYYANNPWDKGHLVRRSDPVWGPLRVAREANAATFFYTNAAPQHENFNQDEWLVLEDWVLEHAVDQAYRLCVFTGPVLLEDDPRLGDAQVPSGFWKVIAVRDATADGDDLSVLAFFMKQAPMSRDKNGKDLLELTRYQVTVAAVEEWTGLDFGDLKRSDELAGAPPQLRAPETGAVGPGFRPVRGPEDLVFSGARRRAQGLRVPPVRPASPPQGLMH